MNHPRILMVFHGIQFAELVNHGHPPAPGMAPVSLGVPAQMPNVRFRVFIPRYWQAMVRTEVACFGVNNYGDRSSIWVNYDITISLRH